MGFKIKVGDRFSYGPYVYEVTHVDEERGMALTYFGIKGKTAWVSIMDLVVEGCKI